jgi:hypothetical protein
MAELEVDNCHDRKVLCELYDATTTRGGNPYKQRQTTPVVAVVTLQPQAPVINDERGNGANRDVHLYRNWNTTAAPATGYSPLEA